MKYTTAEYGNIFFDTQKAVFNVQVTNRSDKAIAGKITAQCSGPGDAREQNAFLSTWTVAAPYTLQAGEAKTIPLDVTPKYRGTFFCTISTEAAGQVLQLRETSFASISRAQLHLIGVAWPPPKGWKRTAIGREVPDEVAAEFVSLRGGGRAPAKPGQD